MRVAVYYNNLDLRLEERPVPRIGPGELLVKVWASGICGSDVMEWYRRPKAPLVLGHEVTGEIVGMGEGVEGYRVGDRVFVSHHVPCLTCSYCLSGHTSVCDTLRTTNFDPGGFAEYIRVPRINIDRGVYILPQGMSYEEGTFIEPLACVVRGQRLARFRPGQSVLVLGSGIAGILHIMLAAALGAGRIIATDIVDYRLKAALRFGAHAALPALEVCHELLCQVNGGRLADLVITCTGTPSAISQAFQSVERGGTILIFAPTEPGAIIPLPLWSLWRDEVTIITSYAGSPADIRTAIELLHYRRLSVLPMITHRLGLAETGLGFSLVASAQDSLKVIIEPQR